MRHDDDPRFNVVRETMEAMYRCNRSRVAPDDQCGLIDLFHPRNVADYLGLEYIEVEKIPSGSSQFKTAGMIDRARRRIYVSTEFPLEQQRFTGMHENVHWMLHKDVGANQLHRDRPVDHVPDPGEVDPVEREATYYAGLCLMPEKLVRARFELVFQTKPGKPIELDDTAAFLLGVDLGELLIMPLRKRSLLLATARSFGRVVEPLHSFFRVSPTALAIRLEELGLVEPPRHTGPPTLGLVT